jgi:hypothetical protein
LCEKEEEETDDEDDEEGADEELEKWVETSLNKGE